MIRKFAKFAERIISMAFTMTVGAGGIPQGTYHVKFEGLEPVAENKEKGYGAGVRWKFVVISGALAGQKTSRVTTTTPTEKNGAGKMLAGLLGRALAVGEQVDVETYIGKPYIALVEAAQGGGTRVGALVSANAPAVV
jgi:hypothetical protein